MEGDARKILQLQSLQLVKWGALERPSYTTPKKNTEPSVLRTAVRVLELANYSPNLETNLFIGRIWL